jgi:hypothetical protein
LKEGEILKYPMIINTENPLFNYIVMLNGDFDCYLYDNFDMALKKAMELSHGTEISLVYEIAFNTETREFRGQNTFTIYDGKVKYDKHARIGLHVQFYIAAGDWLNPNEEWLSILNKKV